MADKRHIYKGTARVGIPELLRVCTDPNVTAKEQRSIHGLWEGQ